MNKLCNIDVTLHIDNFVRIHDFPPCAKKITFVCEIRESTLMVHFSICSIQIHFNIKIHWNQISFSRNLHVR